MFSVIFEVQPKPQRWDAYTVQMPVGQITSDTHIPDGHSLIEQRLDETVTGSAATITLIDGKCFPARVRNA